MSTLDAMDARRPASAAQPGRPAVPAQRRARRGPGIRAPRATVVLTRGLLVVVVLAFLALVVGPRTGRYHVSVVLSGSMRPAWHAGDVLVTTPQAAREVRVGQAISFNAPVDGRPSVTHRVIEVLERGPHPVVRTKGDANDAADPWGPVRLTGDTVGVVRGRVPRLGWALQALNGRVAALLTGLVAPLLLLVLALRQIWRDPARRS